MGEDDWLEAAYEDRFGYPEGDMDGDEPHPDEPYCDYCEEFGHPYGLCPRRDDE